MFAELPAYHGGYMLTLYAETYDTTVFCYLGQFRETARELTVPGTKNATFWIPGDQVIQLEVQTAGSTGDSVLQMAAVQVDSDVRWANTGYRIGRFSKSSDGNETFKRGGTVGASGEVALYGDKISVLIAYSSATSSATVDIEAEWKFGTSSVYTKLGQIDLSTATNAQTFDLPTAAVVSLRAVIAGTGGETVYGQAWAYMSSGE